HLHILGPEAPSDMVRLAASYDVGLASETWHTISRRIALTNKLFTYLLAGVPAALSSTPAQRAFTFETGDATRLYIADDPNSLATALDSLLENSAVLARARAAAFRLGQTRFNWEIEKVVLVDLVAQLPEAGQCGSHGVFSSLTEICQRRDRQ